MSIQLGNDQTVSHRNEPSFQSWQWWIKNSLQMLWKVPKTLTQVLSYIIVSSQEGTFKTKTQQKIWGRRAWTFCFWKNKFSCFVCSRSGTYYALFFECLDLKFLPDIPYCVYWVVAAIWAWVYENAGLNVNFWLKIWIITKLCRFNLRISLRPENSRSSQTIFAHTRMKWKIGCFWVCFHLRKKESRSSETHFRQSEIVSRSSENKVNFRVLSYWFSLKRDNFPQAKKTQKKKFPMKVWFIIIFYFN